MDPQSKILIDAKKLEDWKEYVNQTIKDSQEKINEFIKRAEFHSIREEEKIKNFRQSLNLQERHQKVVEGYLKSLCSLIKKLK